MEIEYELESLKNVSWQMWDLIWDLKDGQDFSKGRTKMKTWQTDTKSQDW